ncbi:MAG TPA: hypothetical protein VHQ41_00690 [Patescibacteria group bacterium]|jgi:hypothetical protein|nr:hypothetical protein [Patescibacteria group bacterium]
MMKQKTEPRAKVGALFLTKMIEATGVTEGIATTVAWFAERMVIAAFALAVVSFAAGSMFVLKLSEPIGDSSVYSAAAFRARLAEDGVKVFSQQVIDVASPVFASLIEDNREPETPKVDQLAIRKQKLKAYLETKNSPFAKDDATLNAFVASKNMKLMVAISFVESTYGQHCYYYNCSGIGGTPPTLRKYDGYAEWVKDFDQLLEDRYKGVPPEKFIGLYVQPGSPNWIYGVKQVIKEFDEQGIEAYQYKNIKDIKTSI